MNQLKIKKLKKFLFAEDEKDIINVSYKKLKKGKLNRAVDLIKQFEPENLAVKFLKYKNPNTVDLILVEKFIIICKKACSNAIYLMSDTVYDQMINKFKMYRDEPIADIIVSKRLRTTQHEFPELKGNIDKANVFFDNEKNNTYDKSLEPFFNRCFEANHGRPIKFKFSFKYDGTSGILTIDENGYVEIALSRGEGNKGAEMTDLTTHLRFNNITRCGLKVEMIITEENKLLYEKFRNKKFSNLRSAIVSIISSSDGSKYSNFISFVPLQATNVKAKDSDKLNELFATDIKYRSKIVECKNTKDAINKARKSVEYILSIRDDLNFDIDGMVIDVVDEELRDKLGRKDNSNLFQVAYKFPPKSALTKLKGVDITVGRTGLITPMLYFNDVYFNNNRYDKVTLSSYDRFKSMNLHENEIIRLTYNNDVMPYPNKYTGEENNSIKDKPLLQFPKRCKCGSKLVMRGANYFCDNIECPHKIIPSYAWFYSSLGIPGLKENTIQKLIDNDIIIDYTDLLNLDYDSMLELEGFGYKSVMTIKKNIHRLTHDVSIDEAKLCTALGISGHKTCKELLSLVTLDVLLKDPNIIYKINIEGFKNKKKKNIIDMIIYKKDEIEFFCKRLNVIPVKPTDDCIKICFSGFRDKDMKETLEALGVIVTDNVTKKTNYLVSKNMDETSSYKKAKDYRIPIISIPELLDLMKTIE